MHVAASAIHRDTQLVHTFGEIFEASGDVIELLADGRLIYRTRASREIIAPLVKVGDVEYSAATLPSDLSRFFIWPKSANHTKEPQELFHEIRSLVERYSDITPAAASLVTFLVFSSWFADCLPFAPCALFSGELGNQRSLFLLLHALCRRAFLTQALNRREFSRLPIGLQPTLLVVDPLGARTTRRVLSSCGDRTCATWGERGAEGLQVVRALYTRTALPEEFSEATFSVHLSGSGKNLRQSEMLRISDQYQCLLLGLRLKLWSSVKNYTCEPKLFTARARTLALAFYPCCFDDAVLSKELARPLADEDEQARVSSATNHNAIVVEALLAMCHEKRSEAYVKDVSEFVRTILFGRGEQPAVQPRAIGEIIRSLGLRARRRSAGWSLDLLEGNRRLVHNLARQLHVLSLIAPPVDCDLCQEVPH